MGKIERCLNTNYSYWYYKIFIFITQ